MRYLISLLSVAALAVAIPQLAYAGGSIPPSNSSVGQYVENVPGAGGNHAAGGNQSGGNHSNDSDRFERAEQSWVS